MNKQENIFLIGPMGVGKTTIGRLLAELLQLKFYDSDEEIEQTTGAPISWIFDVEGESGFRQREKKAIEELTQKNKIVLSTGGGAVLDAENQKLLASRGQVVYLKLSLESQWQRVQKDKSRPLLQTGDPKKKLEQLHKEREKLYLAIANQIIETNGQTPHSICKQIIKEYYG